MNKVLFQYKAETTTSTLLRHHRLARWIIYPCGFFAVLMCSSTAEGLLIGFNPVALTLLIISLGATALLFIPASFSIPWIRDIEVELTKRSALIPGGRDINGRIVEIAGKMMLWAIAIVIGPIVVQQFMRLIPR
jgi:hypothetical protein